MTDRPAPWRDSAACLDSDIAPVEFFTIEVDHDGGPMTRQAVSAARSLAASVCDDCPVRAACLAEAEVERNAPGLAVRPFGLRGGFWYDATTRRPVKADDVRVRVVQETPDARELRPCGTRAAFHRHKAWGEKPCLPCTEAERIYARDSWRRRNAARKAAA